MLHTQQTAAGSKGLSGFVHVVDDDASFRKAMERRLKQAGYEVATYPSALHLLVNLPAESIPSCILLDVRIPGLDGPGLQKRLAELGSTLPIIFLTGYHDIPVTVQAIKAGAHDFLIKPVASDDLFRAIATGFRAPSNTTRSEGQTGQRARPCRAIDAARAGSFRACRSRRSQQADRSGARLYHTDREGPPPQGDGEDAGRNPWRSLCRWPSGSALRRLQRRTSRPTYHRIEFHGTKSARIS